MTKTATPGRTVRLQEFTASPTAKGRIDRAAGVMRGVRVLGPISQNGRRYSEQAMQNAVGLYEGAAVYLDHPGRGEPGSARKVSDRFGTIRNARFARGGIEGDLHYIKSHPLAEAVIEIAESDPLRLGLSHNADGQSERRGGMQEVTKIVKVISVDLVTAPATNKSLFEQVGYGSSPRRSARSHSFLEAVAMGQHGHAMQKRLQEMIPGEIAGEDELDLLRRVVRKTLDDGALAAEQKLQRIRDAVDGKGKPAVESVGYPSTYEEVVRAIKRR